MLHDECSCQKKMLLIGRTFLLILLVVNQHFSHGNCQVRHSLETDKVALLKFKKVITADPNSVLSTWNDSMDVCSFHGVRCNRFHHRVNSLNLSGNELVGSLSPALSNLTLLRNLSLSDNELFGIIPLEFLSLRKLRVLRLHSNNLSGSIPHFLSLLSSQLSILLLMNNSLTGSIPASLFTNCTDLRILDLSSNSLEGTIPTEVGNCPNLQVFHVSRNHLFGRIPSSLANASLLSIDVEYNQLVGEVPSEIVARFPDLLFLHLSYNKFTSHDNNTNLDVFFMALTNCSVLQELELAGMGLEGNLPKSMGNLSRELQHMQLQENRIFGSVPSSLGKLSSLLELNLSFNLLDGYIAPEINQLQTLQQLFLSYNKFRGEIPAALGQLLRIGLLDLSNNMFSGQIPDSLGNLSQLNTLLLNNNLLSGNIPLKLGNLTDIYRLDLSHNQLSGSIPKGILGIREIRIYLNFSHNNLQGTLPFELSKLEKVQEIDLSSNNLTGVIFDQISSCIELRRINFSNNSLGGHLPESLGTLQVLGVLDLSWNKLNGAIPTSLSKVPSLSFLDFSHNNLEGLIPSGGIFDHLNSSSFLGNQKLCGTIPGVRICPRKGHLFHSWIFLTIFIVVICISAFLSTICCVIGYRRLKAVVSSQTEMAADVQNPLDLLPNFPRITYKELEEATGGFDDQRLIGSGSYGRVYKGALPDGTQIAVKVLHVQSGNSTKSFHRECQVLKRIRHRNLMRIITACSQPDFKALVLPYMANGSLDSHLYSHSGAGLSSRSSDLNIIQRVNICSDIAEGMAYLHHHSPVRVIHCDLKPSNVLLNDDMTALVSDFGIARLVITAGGGNAANVENMGDSTANMLSGSIGYIAPEYGFRSNTSIKGDVYSFGVLVLEVVTRKRPTDDRFVEGLSLPRWVKGHFPGRTERVIDSSMIRDLRDQLPEVQRMWEVAIGELIELGLLCTLDHPRNRPTMIDVADDLDRLKRYLGGDTTATFTSSLGISSSNPGDD